MRNPNFRTLDLNLLRVFDQVMAERNLTRAARNLAMTQPAVSNALNRLRDALGDKTGLRRFGEATVPLDEALVTSVVDLSGRPFLVYDVRIKQAKIGSFDVELIHDFLLALTNQAAMNLHVRMASGRNPHHVVEAAFKSLARALDLATQRDPRVVGVLSTKGLL